MRGESCFRQGMDDEGPVLANERLAAFLVEREVIEDTSA